MALIRRGIHLDKHGVDDGAAVFGRLAEAARAAEEAGFDAISAPDHLYHPGGPALPMFEAYTVLGCAGGGHVGGDAACAGQPGHFACARDAGQGRDDARCRVGRPRSARRRRGLGCRQARGIGCRVPGLGERFDRLEEELAICRALYRDEQATFTDKFYAVREARNSPRPVRGFETVLVAGNGEKRTLGLVARYGDACNVFGDPADVRRKLEVLDRHSERAGRDPAEFTRTVAEFNAPDLCALAASARALAAADADGMIIACPDDPARIAAIGQVLKPDL